MKNIQFENSIQIVPIVTKKNANVSTKRKTF